MKLVATVRAPERPEEAATVVAHAANLTLAEARMRLAREPPALLALLESDSAGALASALRRSGLAALAIDSHVPSDNDRTVARTAAFTDTGATFAPRSGEPMEVAWPDIVAVFRGAREFHSETETMEKVAKPSLETAIITQGLWVTTTSKKTVRSSRSSTQHVLLAYGRDGAAAMIVDDDFDFSCLGASKQPSSTANMAELARRLRDKASNAFYDERLLRLGTRPLPFVAGNEWRSNTGTTFVLRSDTRASLDVLAEVMRQAVARRMLP